ncbi:MAG TPA: pilin [Candidatus Saccharimonadales bacterium]|nr:pilin [Candidatus Saccharimonadales bacterium]
MKFLNNLRRIFIPTALLLTALVGLNLSSPISAYACGGTSGTSKDQVLNGVGETGDTCNGSGVTNTISAAVKILSIITGAAAIIMIIYSGLRYITSGGDSARISSAKNTLIYALIGLAIAVLAQLLVTFILTQSTNVTNNCGVNQHFDSSANKCVKN